MLIDIHQLIHNYNELVVSKKYHQISEDLIIKLYTTLVKRNINLHETNNYVLNEFMLSEFISKYAHILKLKSLNIKRDIIPRQLRHLKRYPPVSKKNEIGEYKIEKKLGEGYFGKVYLVTKTENKIKRQYALKQINLYSKDTSPISVNKEINILQHLSSIKPQIAPKFIEAFIQNNYINIVQQYINCGTLNEYTKLHPLTTKMKKQIRNLINVLHETKIFHKDLHTENILVNCDPKTDEPTFLISDFGEAKTLKNVQDDDYALIQDIKNTDKSIEERISRIPVESMLFDIIIDEILRSTLTPKLVKYEQ